MNWIKEIKDKIKKTSLNKYGTEFISQSVVKNQVKKIIVKNVNVSEPNKRVWKNMVGEYFSRFKELVLSYWKSFF